MPVHVVVRAIAGRTSNAEGYAACEADLYCYGGNGRTVAEIAETHAVSEHTVRTIARRLSVQLFEQTIVYNTPDARDAVRRMRDQGLKHSAIAKELDMTVRQVRACLYKKDAR